MFLNNNPLLFNLESVPPAIRECWEQHHGGRNLNDLGRVSRTVVMIRAIASILVFFSGVVLYYPVLSSTFGRHWYCAVANGVLSSSFYLLFTTRFLTPPHHELYKEFIQEYRRLMFLLNGEWRYGHIYPTAGPGVQPSFDALEPFVREKLVVLAGKIKRMEVSVEGKTDYLGLKDDAKALRAEFGSWFDILRPFGLVYPSYEPYFDPDGAYFFG